VGNNILLDHGIFIFIFTLKMVAVGFFENLMGPATYTILGCHYPEDKSANPYRLWAHVASDMVQWRAL
jgi:hypothetical protein